jgi:type II secretion system protein G
LRGRGPAIAGLIASVCTLLVWVLAAGIGGGVYFYDRTQMEESRRSYEVNQTRKSLSEIEAALNRYQDDIGHPPTIDEGGLRALLRKPQDPQVASKWKGPYLTGSPEEMPLDPWGGELNYKPLPSPGGTPYRLWSNGPDGLSGTPDDLSLESSEEKPPAAPTTAAPAESTQDLGGGVTMKLVLIRPGKFVMGDGKDRHEVTLSKPFYMGVTEVTQAQYEAVMGTNPSHFRGATNPVEMVYWNDAAEFCKKLSEKTRRTFRLPTEAEWEYACRAGAQTAFSFGDDPSALGDYAWWGRNSADTTHPVGQKKPNAWGLYDMHGNVWEWCADWYEAYPKGPVTNPSGPATGRYHVLHGGSWTYVDADCFRCAFRLYYDPAPSLRNFNYGFRCAGTLP